MRNKETVHSKVKSQHDQSHTAKSTADTAKSEPGLHRESILDQEEVNYLSEVPAIPCPHCAQPSDFEGSCGAPLLCKGTGHNHLLWRIKL